MFPPSSLVNNVPDYKTEKVEIFHLCILSFSEVLYTLEIIIKDTRAYTVLFVWQAQMNTNALILAQYLIVALKGHELLLLPKGKKKKKMEGGSTLQILFRKTWTRIELDN